MSEWRNIWANGLPNEDRSPKSGPRMAAEGMKSPLRWNGGPISPIIWMSSGECRDYLKAGELPERPIEYASTSNFFLHRGHGFAKRDEQTRG